MITFELFSLFVQALAAGTTVMLILMYVKNFRAIFKAIDGIHDIMEGHLKNHSAYMRADMQESCAKDQQLLWLSEQVYQLKNAQFPLPPTQDAERRLKHDVDFIEARMRGR